MSEMFEDTRKNDKRVLEADCGILWYSIRIEILGHFCPLFIIYIPRIADGVFCLHTHSRSKFPSKTL